MTESPLPYGAVEEAPAEAEAESGSKRNLVALGGLAAVLLAGGAFFLLSGGEEVEDEIAFVPAKARPAVVAAAPPKVAKLPVPTKVALGRNPFKALYVQPAAVSAPSGGAPTTPVAVTPVGGAAPIIVLGPGSTLPVAPRPVAAPFPVVQPLAPAPFPVQPPVLRPPPAPVPAPQPAPVQQPAPQQPPAAQPAPRPAPAPASDGTVSLASVKAEGNTAEGTFQYEGMTLRGGQGDVMGGQLLVVSLTQSDDGRWVAVLKRGDGGAFEVREGEKVVVR